MSRHTAEVALDALVGRPAYVEDRYAAGEPEGLGSAVLGHLRRLASAVPAQEITSWDERRAQLVADYGMSQGPTDKPFAYADGVAIIPIHGLLINRFAYSWGFVTGYNFIRQQFQAALIDPDVKLIAFDVNSQGGMVAGCRELSDELYAARGEKPTVAVVDSSCFSAAYYIASAADRVVVTPTAGIGSIGCLAMRIDITKAFEEMGLKATILYAGANKLDWNPLVPFSPEAQARVQASIDTCYENFVAAVARNRGIEPQAVRDTEASCYDPPEALALGLIDSIQPPNAALEAALNEMCGDAEDADEDPNDDTGDDMPKTPEQLAAEAAAAQAATQAEAVRTAQAEARTAERTRIAAIQGHAEAKGKAGLAAHLALNTALSVEESAAMLKAAAPEAAPVAVVQPPAANALEQAMEGTKQPNVTGEGGQQQPGTGTESTPQTIAAGILAAQARATGVSHAKH